MSRTAWGRGRIVLTPYDRHSRLHGRQARWARARHFREKGQSGNLPTGEAYLAPLEGQSNGVVVVDGSMAGVGMVSQPLRIVVEQGYATQISGGCATARLASMASTNVDS